ncbi:MAG: hypothetical protein IH900_01030 [Proteobacteria bacterium]|nr:hypothetical protein [Pseudomonadota bacterium]
MRQLTLAAVVAAALLTAGAARAAESWGLPGEEIVRFEAKVVDLLCELTGDCPAQCGAGTRQLGLLKDDGTLVLPLKNQTFFSGAVDELIDFCAKRVVADGLMVTNRGYTIFALQFVKAAPDGKWRRADRFLSKWAKRNGLDPKDKKVKRWFENDPRVEALIARDGKLGLGLEADRKFLEAQ